MDHQCETSRRIENDNTTNNNGGNPKLEDRLSSLPDHILADILSLLWLKPAVATAALSRRWRFLWTHLTAVRHYEISPERNLMNVAIEILPNLTSQLIRSFKFRCASPSVYPPICMDYFSTSIAQICARHVSKIELNFCENDSSRRQLLLPSCVFECESLEILDLGDGLDFKLPDNGIRVPNLRELYVCLYDRDVEFMLNLFKSCPRLEMLEVILQLVNYELVDITCGSSLKRLKLSMRHQFQTPRFVINAPKLERLRIRDGNVTRYSFAEAPTALVKAKLVTWGFYPKGEYCKLIESIRNVETLSLSGRIYSILSSRKDGAMPIFNRLTKISGDLRSWACWKALTCLLKRCPNLRVLGIRSSPCRWYAKNWYAFGRLPTCLSTNVKRIKLVLQEGGQHELKLIRFILTVAKVLETLDINVFPSSELKEFGFYQKVCKLPRSSPTCKINFL